MVTYSRSVIRYHLLNYLVTSYASKASRLGPLLRRMPLNATTKQVLALGRSEQMAYLETLWRFNAARATAASCSTTVVPAAAQPMYKEAGFFRQFNQLPCTLATRLARAELLGGADRAETQVLILGDDDLLSVELAGRGFRGVTVADCDPELLSRIGSATKDLATPPRIVQADFRKGYTAEPKADVVFLDPPYSVDGALAFLQLALRALSPDRAARIYLMINPDILGSSFSELTSAAARQGLRLTARYPGFNAYPLGRMESAVLRLAWRIALNRRAPAVSGLHYCSDCFQFERV